MCGLSAIRRKGVRCVEYGRWHIERGWGASNKVGGALKVPGLCRKWRGCVESGRVVSKVAGLCRKWPGHAERGRELLEGWEYVGGCVGLVEQGGARRAGAGGPRMGQGVCLGCRRGWPDMGRGTACHWGSGASLWDGWVALGYVRRGQAARGTSGVAAARWRGLRRVGEGRERLSDLGAWHGRGWGPLRGSVRAGAPWHGGCASRRDGAHQRGGRGASAHVQRCGAGRGHVRERWGASRPGGACVTRSRRRGARLVWWPTEGHVSGVMGVTCCRWCSRRRRLGWPGGMAGTGGHVR